MSGTILCLPAAWFFRLALRLRASECRGTLYAAKGCFVLSTCMARSIRSLLGKLQPKNGQGFRILFFDAP